MLARSEHAREGSRLYEQGHEYKHQERDEALRDRNQRYQVWPAGMRSVVGGDGLSKGSLRSKD